MLTDFNNSFTFAFFYELSLTERVETRSTIAPQICCRTTLRNLNVQLHSCSFILGLTGIMYTPDVNIVLRLYIVRYCWFTNLSIAYYLVSANVVSHQCNILRQCLLTTIARHWHIHWPVAWPNQSMRVFWNHWQIYHMLRNCKLICLDI